MNENMCPRPIKIFLQAVERDKGKKGKISKKRKKSKKKQSKKGKKKKDKDLTPDRTTEVKIFFAPLMFVNDVLCREYSQ